VQFRERGTTARKVAAQLRVFGADGDVGVPGTGPEQQAPQVCGDE